MLFFSDFFIVGSEYQHFSLSTSTDNEFQLSFIRPMTWSGNKELLSLEISCY